MNQGTSWLRYLNQKRLRELTEPVFICAEKPLAVLMPYEQFLALHKCEENAYHLVEEYKLCQAQQT